MCLIPKFLILLPPVVIWKTTVWCGVTAALSEKHNTQISSRLISVLFCNFVTLTLIQSVPQLGVHLKRSSACGRQEDHLLLLVIHCLIIIVAVKSFLNLLFKMISQAEKQLNFIQRDSWFIKLISLFFYAQEMIIEMWNAHCLWKYWAYSYSKEEYILF